MLAHPHGIRTAARVHWSLWKYSGLGLDMRSIAQRAARACGWADVKMIILNLDRWNGT
ncbi:MAG: hypothetical protein JWR77_2171 [Rhizorhabdus sp.]|nr:hypothetical protein [Rhizorhabdus sp.]